MHFSKVVFAFASCAGEDRAIGPEYQELDVVDEPCRGVRVGLPLVKGEKQHLFRTSTNQCLSSFEWWKTNCLLISTKVSHISARSITWRQRRRNVSQVAVVLASAFNRRATAKLYCPAKMR